MYDEEKNNIKSVAFDTKKEIAETTQLQVTDVTDVIQKYTQMEQFHKWLKNKQAKGEPVPETRDELMQMYRIERPEFLMPRRHTRGTKSRQSEFLYRRHHT